MRIEIRDPRLRGNEAKERRARRARGGGRDSERRVEWRRERAEAGVAARGLGLTLSVFVSSFSGGAQTSISRDAGPFGDRVALGCRVAASHRVALSALEPALPHPGGLPSTRA